MSETARVKYLYLDVVGFTKNRTVEAQSDIVEYLNRIIRGSFAGVGVKDSAILIPTGDGVVIALVDEPSFDIHLRLGLEILSQIRNHNGTQSDKMRQFSVRMGLNENVDNLITDVNGKPNVAGSGISMAQRIMDKADGDQILVGQTVFETLNPREKYVGAFRKFETRDKHGAIFPVYQLVGERFPGLNVEVPSLFAPRKEAKPKFTEFVAYYIAHAASNRDFFLARTDAPTRNYTATVLLSFLAEDSVEKAHTAPHDTADPDTWGAGKASFEEQFWHYDDLEFQPLCTLATLLGKKTLAPYSEYFELSDGIFTNYAFVRPSGLKKLREEWPRIADEFGLP